MKVELTPEEAQNVRVALRTLAKVPEVNENGMKVLLILSDKFAVEEQPKKDKPKNENP